MYRITALLSRFSLTFLTIFSGNALAEVKLERSCNIIFDHYGSIDNATTSKVIVLTNHKHSPEGIVKEA
jgi:hypothetical protein